MNETETLWTHREKKFKPRNLQAVKITFKAKGLHVAPVEPTPNIKEQRKAAYAALQKRADELRKEGVARELELKKQQAEERVRQKAIKATRPAKSMWLARHLRSRAKLAGKPKPTAEELRAARKKCSTEIDAKFKKPVPSSPPELDK